MTILMQILVKYVENGKIYVSVIRKKRRKMFHKCNLCNPPEGDRNVIIMNGVPLRVFHTMEHGNELVEKLMKPSTDRIVWDGMKKKNYKQEYSIVSLDTLLVPCHSQEPSQVSPLHS